MPLNREKEICSQSRGFLQAIICLLEITTLTISQQQHQHIVKKGECGSERKDGKRLVVLFFFNSFTLNKAKRNPEI